MIQTIALFIALTTSLVFIIHFMSNIISMICDAMIKKEYSFDGITSLILGSITIISWCLFYYLTL